ncbi:MAG TPA: CAP domain-containing protein [Solirubrobacterales bacterium]|nr:CAP domain-containing protein [Solirubrobacterales bacterium]
MTRLLALVACSIALLGAAAYAAAAPSPAPTGIDRLLAPASACPHQNQPTLANKMQLQAMLCLTNYARSHSKLARISASTQLAQAAAGKVRDILRCGEFSHEACGREFTYWMEKSGYLSGSCWEAAENIAWGTGTIGTPRAIMRAWLHSSGHRENILGPYTDIGIGLREGTIEGSADAHVWVQEFGSHTC